MSEIFVSYRSVDAQYGAAAIYELLATRVDRARIFLDNQSISPGAAYPERLRAALDTVRVVLVLIGPRWLVPDPDVPERQPIQDEHDWVRQEIRRAFERSVRVVPILFDGARMPAPEALPPDVRPLVHCQAVEVSHLRLGEDVTRLVDRLAELLPALSIATAGRTPVPRQLPAPPPWFVGRRRELDQLTREAEVDGRQAVTVLVGIGGIGKTWLALHWAHTHADRFPDGQLYVDLRGSSPAGRPMGVATALRCLLDGLGVDHRTVPTDVDAQLGRYRSLVAGRRLLVVLDNADNAAQVSALLPGTPTAAVLVTSRDRLDGLLTSVGTRRLTLAPLTAAEARELFLRRFGQERVAAESTAVATLIGYCAGLPLALGIVAGRVAGEDDLPLSASAEELRDTATRVGALDAGDPATSVTAVLSWSYDALSPADARVFAALGLAPGRGTGVAAVASLTALPPAVVRASMRALTRLSLVQRHDHDRWQLHSLVHLYAADRAERTLTEADRTAATRRIVDHYLHTAYTADRWLDVSREPITLDPPAAGVRPEDVADREAATAWFTAEHDSLLGAMAVAGARGWHRTVWELAWVTHSFQWQQGHVRRQAANWRAALAAAEALADPALRAVAHRLVGSAVARTGPPAEAADHLRRALRLATELDDRRTLAHTHRALARLRERLGDHQRALEHATEARRRYRELAVRHNEADALDMMCWYLTQLGRYEDAMAHGASAIAMYRELGNRDGEATALDSLGHVAHRTARYAQARDCYLGALALFSGANAYHEAGTLERLGEVCVRLSRTEEARVAWTRCLSRYEAQDRHAEAATIRERLAALTEPTPGAPE